MEGSARDHPHNVTLAYYGRIDSPVSSNPIYLHLASLFLYLLTWIAALSFLVTTVSRHIDGTGDPVFVPHRQVVFPTSALQN